MSRLLVHVNDPGCNCKEDGADGTPNHGEVIGKAEVVLCDGALKVTAEFCENHRKNYKHWAEIGDVQSLTKLSEKWCTLARQGCGLSAKYHSLMEQQNRHCDQCVKIAEMLAEFQPVIEKLLECGGEMRLVVQEIKPKLAAEWDDLVGKVRNG